MKAFRDQSTAPTRLVRSLVAILSCMLGGILQAESPPNRLEQQPSCGVRAVLSWLAIHGRDARISDVSRQFKDVGMSAPTAETDLSQITRVLSDNGFRVEAVRWPVAEASVPQLALPCIVHLASPNSAAPEHFAVLVKRDDEKVWMLDGATGSGVAELPTDRFLEYWTGVTVQSTGHDSFARPVRLGLLCAGIFFLVSVVIGWLSSRRELGKSVAILTIACSLNGAVGCSRVANHQADKKEAIRITDPVRRLGAITTPGTRVERFEFHVTAPTAVTISAIKPCCGMKLRDTSIIGRSLESGTDHRIELEFSIIERAASFTKTAAIEFSDSTVASAAIAITGRYLGPPKLESSRVVVNVAENGEAETSFVARRWRRPADTSLQLISSKSKSDAIAVKRVEQTAEPADEFGEALICDVTTIVATVRAGGRRKGDYSDLLPLVWSDGTEQKVSMFLRVRPNHYCEPDHLYFGSLKAGEVRRAEVKLLRFDGTPVRGERVACSSPQFTATLSESRSVVTVEFTAPKQTGRCEGKVSVGVLDSSSDATFDVAAIVRDESSALNAPASRD